MVGQGWTDWTDRPGRSPRVTPLRNLSHKFTPCFSRFGPTGNASLPHMALVFSLIWAIGEEPLCSDSILISPPVSGWNYDDSGGTGNGVLETGTRLLRSCGLYAAECRRAAGGGEKGE
jgi:hypothetical protein